MANDDVAIMWNAHRNAWEAWSKSEVLAHASTLQPLRDKYPDATIGPKPEKVGTVCECGAPYAYLERHKAWGYTCAR